jgi:2'-5' RNA ligase
MSRGATARLFVAVDPPAAVCAELVLWARGVVTGLSPGVARGASRPLRLLEAEALHLTLCFVGSRPVGEIEVIGSALERSAAPVGELCVGAPLWLPPRRPRTLAVEIHDRGGGLARLHDAVSDAIASAIGWEPERRRFRAHVTVARVRGGAALRRGWAGKEPGLPATPRLRFVPSSVVLYRSWLSSAGATYEPLTTCTLTASGL